MQAEGSFEFVQGLRFRVYWGYIGIRGLGFRVSLRVHVPNNLVLGFWVIIVIVQVLGKHMIIRYLDP